MGALNSPSPLPKLPHVVRNVPHGSVVDVVDVVVGQGFGEQVPAPPFIPPSAVHCVALSTTQAKAPIGDDCLQHWIGASVVVVVLLVDVVVVLLVDVVVVLLVVDAVLDVVVELVVLVVVELVLVVELGKLCTGRSTRSSSITSSDLRRASLVGPRDRRWVERHAGPFGRGSTTGSG
jgi:hypothetical protein